MSGVEEIERLEAMLPASLLADSLDRTPFITAIFTLPKFGPIMALRPSVPYVPGVVFANRVTSKNRAILSPLLREPLSPG